MEQSKASDSAAYLTAHLLPLLRQPLSAIDSAYSQSHQNIQTILRRQIVPNSRPGCRIQGEEALVESLRDASLTEILFTLARVYDAGHVAICKNYASAKRGKPYNVGLLKDPCVDVSRLTEGIREDQQKRHEDIKLISSHAQPNVLQATWMPLPSMSFDHLPVLKSLSELLPGEVSPGKEYAGIGGGGGSDIISASLLGHLLRQIDKEMNLLVSTRTWRTGSQGKEGTSLGIKREVHRHGGAAVLNNKPVGGTYRIKPETWTEGRDLETVPVGSHQDIFLVLDQGEETQGIAENEKADLSDQFRAVLSQCAELDTVIVVDTGGDVFGSDFAGFTTPDQDVRVQRAMATLQDSYTNLVTAVLAPGVDAPADAPEKAKQAGGKVYKLRPEERTLVLDLLGPKYHMDGSDPDRYGKTNLCLQAALRGRRGWTCLDLPTNVVDTWENPWGCFAYVRECMSDIILMPLLDLLPLID